MKKSNYMYFLKITCLSLFSVFANNAKSQAIVFSDNFDDNTIDKSCWTNWGTSVVESGQTMQILQNATDAGGNLQSKAIPLNATGVITITRNVRVHSASSYYLAGLYLNFGSLPNVSIRYGNMSYNSLPHRAVYGFYICRNNTDPHSAYYNPNDVSSRVTPLWDMWFKETIIYNPLSGDLYYSINDELRTLFNVGVMPQTNSPSLKLTLNSWGWNKGHSHFMDNLSISQTGDLAANIVFSPTNLTVKGGTRASFSVVAGGAGPHTYQWRKGLSNITGATNSTLTIDIASAYDAGYYSVRVYNDYSLLGATSSSAKLTVLGGEMYSQTSCQIPEPVPFEKLPGQDSLIVITHGWQPLGALADVSWMEDMANAIRANLAIQGKTNWRVETYNWSFWAWPLPETALANGNNLGSLLGMKLGHQSWDHIHLIGHSAGAQVIQAATERIKWLSPETTVHTTFLDPYIGVRIFGQRYGLNADFAENYFSDDWTGRWTGTRLLHAHNVNVTQLDPDHTGGLPVFTSGSSMPSSTPAVIASQEESSHPYPHDFYLSTIELRCSLEADGYGFPLSKEGGGWDNRANYQPGNDPEILGEPAARIQGFVTSVTTGTAFDFNSLANVSSDTGASVMSCALQLSSTQSFPSQPSPTYMMQYADPLSETSNTSWLSAAVTVTSAVNFVSCDIAFTGPAYAQGLLTVYWETNVIATVDERAVLTGSPSYRFPLSDTFPAGTYALGFRLDSFTNITSSVTVTNVAAGFAGSLSPMSLDVSSTNNGMFMTLSGPSQYNYLVEASTNLVNWTPFAILSNTNGAVQFCDPDAGNYKQRFYRAVRP